MQEFGDEIDAKIFTRLQLRVMVSDDDRSHIGPGAQFDPAGNDLYSGKKHLRLIQSSAVIMGPNITRYCIHHCRNRGRISVGGWTHKRHPISCPNGQVMACLLWILFWENWLHCNSTARTVQFEYLYTHSNFTGTAALLCFVGVRHWPILFEFHWNLFLRVQWQ